MRFWTRIQGERDLYYLIVRRYLENEVIRPKVCTVGDIILLHMAQIMQRGYLICRHEYTSRRYKFA